MIIRDETPSDHTAIRDLVISAFGQTDEADLVEWLRADGDSVIELVAADDGGIVGHVMFSKMTAPFRALGLAPVSVAPGRQRAGIGSRLIRAGLERAREQGWQGVFVVGDPAYYSRFGFDAALARGFASSYAGPYLMALALDGPLPVREGRIDYAPAFERLG
jgi:putative acetyltransferase